MSNQITPNPVNINEALKSGGPTLDNPPIAPTVPSASITPTTPIASVTPTPQPVPSTPSLVEGGNYIVQTGDNLTSIAKKLGIQPTQLTGYRSGNPNLIYPGEKLSIVGQNMQSSINVPPLKTNASQGQNNANTATPPAISANTPSALAPTTPTDFINQYTTSLEKLGIPTIKTQYENVQKQFNNLQNELNDKKAETNNNPWLSEGIRIRTNEQLDKKYEGKLDILTNQMKLYDSLYQEGVAQAKFLTTGEITQQEHTQALAEKKLEAENRIKELVAENKFKNIKEVNGGLYDLENNNWIVRPKVTTQIVKSGGLIIPESTISTGQLKLDHSRGSDNYANSGIYLQMLGAWKRDGGLEQDFFDKYPPKNYLNPNDASIPQYIRDKLKASSGREL